MCESVYIPINSFITSVLGAVSRALRSNLADQFNRYGRQKEEEKKIVFMS